MMESDYYAEQNVQHSLYVIPYQGDGPQCRQLLGGKLFPDIVSAGLCAAG
jgi:hypothetical protein